MSVFTKAAGTAVICLICCIILKNVRAEYAVLAGTAGAFCVLLLIIPQIKSAADVLDGFCSRLGEGEEYMAYFAKACAVACISSLISCECRDTGNGTLAQVSELAGKVCIIIIGLPMIKTVLGAIISMLE